MNRRGVKVAPQMIILRTFRRQNLIFWKARICSTGSEAVFSTLTKNTAETNPKNPTHKASTVRLHLAKLSANAKLASVTTRRMAPKKSKDVSRSRLSRSEGNVHRSPSTVKAKGIRNQKTACQPKASVKAPPITGPTAPAAANIAA